MNRPKALNALSDDLMHELNDLLFKLDKDDNIGCIVLTGSEKAFAAGADIKQMKDKTGIEAYKNELLGHWDNITEIRYYYIYLITSKFIENLLLLLLMVML